MTKMHTCNNVEWNNIEWNFPSPLNMVGTWKCYADIKITSCGSSILIRYENILVLLPIFPSPHRRMGPLSFRGLRSVARIFYPLLAWKSSGFAQILHDFCPKMAIWEISRGLQPPSPPPPPRMPMLLLGILWEARENSTLFSSTLFPASNTKCLKEIHLNEFIYKLFGNTVVSHTPSACVDKINCRSMWRTLIPSTHTPYGRLVGSIRGVRNYSITNCFVWKLCRCNWK